jgi:sugar lactone lactonase YvrE
MSGLPARPVRRLFAALLAAVALLLAGPAPAGAGGSVATAFPEVIELPRGFQPEGITAGREATFYAGSLRNGAIYRGDVRTGRGAVLVPGRAGAVTVGVDYDRANHRLWAAGGDTEVVRVFDAGTGALLRTYRFPGAGFLNDVAVTPDAVYVTDSFSQVLHVVPLGSGGWLPRPGRAFDLPLTGDIRFRDGFNVNGIVAVPDGSVLFIVQSNTGFLFRVDPRTGVARRVGLAGALVTFGDGLELRGRPLFVVRNQLNQVDVVRLGPALRAGRVVDTLTDPRLDVPTTAAVVADRLYVVNARFGTTPTPTTRYTVVQLARL